MGLFNLKRVTLLGDQVEYGALYIFFPWGGHLHGSEAAIGIRKSWNWRFWQPSEHEGLKVLKNGGFSFGGVEDSEVVVGCLGGASDPCIIGQICWEKKWFFFCPPPNIFFFVPPPSDIRDTKLKDKKVFISLYCSWEFHTRLGVGCLGCVYWEKDINYVDKKKYS